MGNALNLFTGMFGAQALSQSGAAAAAAGSECSRHCKIFFGGSERGLDMEMKQMWVLGGPLGCWWLAKKTGGKECLQVDRLSS